jgi:transcriptional regulator with XRE-family HTH domain
MRAGPVAQVVSGNVRRLRRERRLTQVEAAESLAAVSDGRYRWSKAVWSWMEQGNRGFTADELNALALTFAVKVGDFFDVPPPMVKCPTCRGAGRIKAPAELEEAR